MSLENVSKSLVTQGRFPAFMAASVLKPPTPRLFCLHPIIGSISNAVSYYREVVKAGIETFEHGANTGCKACNKGMGY